MVGDSFGGFGHGFEEVVLRGQVAPYFLLVAGLAGGVYPCFAVGGGDADGDVLDGSSEASHGVSFEVGEHEGEVIAGVVLADKVFLEVLAAFYGE